jgi:uncharacterized membrane-anchored protein YhcB (DUF1043 family)
MILRCVATGARVGSGGGPVGAIIGGICGFVVGVVGTVIYMNRKEKARQKKTQSVIKSLEERLRKVEDELASSKSLSQDYIEKLRRDRDKLREKLQRMRKDL